MIWLIGMMLYLAIAWKLWEIADVPRILTGKREQLSNPLVVAALIFAFLATPPLCLFSVVAGIIDRSFNAK